jgi:hypothetical protein
LHQSRIVRYPARPFALATSKSSQTKLRQCSGSQTREETKRKKSLFDMEFSQPQRRDRVRGLARGLGGIKSLNFPGGSETQQRGSADLRRDRTSQAFAGHNSEQKTGFRLTSRAASAFPALPIRRKDSESAVRTGGGGSDYQTWWQLLLQFHLLGL